MSSLLDGMRVGRQGSLDLGDKAGPGEHLMGGSGHLGLTIGDIPLSRPKMGIVRPKCKKDGH